MFELTGVFCLCLRARLALLYFVGLILRALRMCQLEHVLVVALARTHFRLTQTPLGSSGGGRRNVTMIRPLRRALHPYQPRRDKNADSVADCVQHTSKAHNTAPQAAQATVS
jgi:hypothetical protein